jgi:hypothetical protein
MRGNSYGIALLFVIAGCVPQERTPANSADADALGDPEIVLRPLTDRVYASVSDSPDFSLGGANATGPVQFDNIRGVVALADREIWVADGTSGELRVFSLDGRHLRTMGGKGRGPGEYQLPRLLGSFHGDSVAVWDDANPRLTVYGPDGLVGRTAAPSGDGMPPQAFGVFSDGSLLGQIPHIFGAAGLKPGAILADTLNVQRIDLATSEWPTLAAVPTAQWLWTGQDQVPLPFSVNPRFSVCGEKLAWVNGAESRVYAVDLSGRQLVFGVDRPVKPVDARDVAAYRSYMEEALPDGPTRRAYLDALDNPSRPDVLPAYDELACEGSGVMWAERYVPAPSGPREWDVYDPAGSWQGAVSTPPGFAVKAVTDQALVGVWRDPTGVEFVRAYEFTVGGLSN